MSPFRFILICTASTGCLLANPEESATMCFTNNDQITGQLASISTDTLVWNSSILAEPATFSTDQVLNLSLPAKSQASDSKHVAVLTLKNRDMRNADVARGQLASITEDSIVIDTWYAGLMSFKRSMVASVRIEGPSQFQYQGPTGPEGWIQSESPPAWKYHRSAFISNNTGSIARANALPDECSVSFDVEWKDALNMKVLLFSNDPKVQSPQSGYEIAFQRSSIYLRSGTKRRYLGNAHSPDLAQNEMAHIEIRSSKKSGKTVLLINKSPVEMLSDPELEGSVFGDCLHFVSNQSKAMRISDIKITPWDGKIDEQPRLAMRMGNPNEQQTPARPKVEPKVDANRMMLANGDSIIGEALDIKDGNITLKTELGDFNVPVERFSDLSLKDLGSEESKKYNGDIRASFPDGSSLVFRLEAIHDNTIDGFSQNFGTAKFNISSINRIDFNLYEPKFDDLRKANDW